MHCESLWIKASAKCINVNLHVTLYHKTSHKLYGYICSNSQQYIGQNSIFFFYAENDLYIK